MLAEEDIDASVTGVTFTNKSKSDMVIKTTIAIEQGWHRAPRIEQLEAEFASYELQVTKAGNHTYGAPDGEHDDIVSAAMLAISSAYQSTMAEDAEKMLQQAIGGNINHDDSSDIIDYAMGRDDDFFDDDKDEAFDLDYNEV